MTSPPCLQTPLPRELESRGAGNRQVLGMLGPSVTVGKMAMRMKPWRRTGSLSTDDLDVYHVAESYNVIDTRTRQHLQNWEPWCAL